VASTEAVFNEQYDCLKCISRFKDKDSAEKQKELKSCLKGNVFRFQISNIKFSKCPGNYSLPQISYYLGLFFIYEKHGILPEGTSLMDSNYKLHQILSIIEDRVEYNRKKIRDKESAKVKRKR